MKKFFTSIIALFFLFILSVLFYLVWILNKGEFESEYLKDFLNDRLKKPGLFYSQIDTPKIKFDTKNKKLMIQGNNFKINKESGENIAEFDNLKVYLNLRNLLIKRKLDAEKLYLEQGIISMPNVFSEPLKIERIYLEGKLYPENDEIELSHFLTDIKEDHYEGSAKINLEDLNAVGNLTDLTRKNIFYNMDLVSNNLDFSANSFGFDIEGEALLGGIDILLKGRKNYINHEDYVSKYNVQTIINEKDIENSFKIKIEDFISGPIELNGTYFILNSNKERIETINNLKNSTLSFPLLGLSKSSDIDATTKINFYFSNGVLDNLKILGYQEGNKKLSGTIQYSKEFKPYKSLELNFEKDLKKVEIKLNRNKNLNTLKLKADYFDFTKVLEDFLFEKKDDENPLTPLQPIEIFLNSKEILVTDDNSIFNTNATMKYDKNLFAEMKLDSTLEKDKTFNLKITPKDNSREVIITSNDAGLFMKKFNINKSGKKGEFVMHGTYDDSKETHPLEASVTIRDISLIKAPTLAKILNLASIGIVSALSGEGILINKLKSEFLLEDGVLHLKKYEAYGPDIGFSNQGNVYLRKKEIDLEGALVPMVTLNRIIGSIPVLGKILTNERKGIWSFIYTIKGDINEPKVQVDPLKSITPGFLKKFFSFFKSEKKSED